MTTVSKTEAPPTKLRVLLIEDDEADVFLVREILKGSAQKSGVAYDLDVAGSVADGLAKLRDGAHDVVLLDLNLPDSRGIETLRRVVAGAGDRPVIVLSGVNDESMSMEAAANGAHDYLVKGHVESMWLSRIMRYAVARQSNAAARSSGTHADLLTKIAEGAKALSAQTREREKAETVLAAMMDSIPDGIIACDADGHIVLANQACKRIAGADLTHYTPEQLGRRFEFFRADRTTRYALEQLPLFRCLRGENVDNDEVFLRTSARPSGFWVSVNARPVRDAAGTVTGAVAVFRDVTEPKLAEHRLADQRRCLDLVGRVAAIANMADEAKTGLRDALRATCESFSWDAGHVLAFKRPAGKIVSTGIWHLASEKLQKFSEAAGAIDILPDLGLVGKVVSSGRPAWTADMTLDKHCPRAPLAVRNGLQFSLAAPVKTAEGITGALEFFSRTPAELTQPSLDVLDQIGFHLGRMVERLRF